VAIFHAVTDPGRAHKPVQLVAVRMNERVVLLDHELGVAAIGGEVLDESSEARSPSCTVGGIVPYRFINRGFDLRCH
jgi:hypothetical protein